MDVEQKTDLFNVGVEQTQMEVRPQRSVSLDQFPRGVIDLSFTVGGTFAWVPNRSYVRIACTIKNPAGNPPGEFDNIAFADNVCGNLFDNCFMRAGQQNVSSIVSYLSQASQLKNRLTKSGAWVNSFGKSAYGQDPSFASRVQSVSLSGRAVGEVYDVAIGDGGTASIGVGTNVVTLAGATNFAQFEIGDILVIEGQQWEIATPPTDAIGAGMTVTQVSVAAIAATDQAFIRKVNQTPRKQTVYIMWVPPIGIFDSDRPLGSGDYRLSLNPYSNYKRTCVQALEDLTPGTGFDFEVEDLSFFPYITRTNMPTSGIDKLELSEIYVQTKSVTNNKTNQIEVTVPPSTYSICVFVQANSATSNTKNPPSVFKALDRSDERLKNLQISYANVNKPSTNWSSDYSTTENYMTQRYHDTQCESGMIYNDGGGETFPEWLERGPYYCYSFLRDASDRSTHCNVNMSYENLQTDTTIFVCALYRRVAEISYQSGRVTSVQTLSV